MYPKRIIARLLNNQGYTITVNQINGYVEPVTLFGDSNFMIHRHLNHQRFTLAAIDNVISRGKWQDWAELRRAALGDRALLDKVDRVCRPYLSDPYAQRYHFWMHYAKEHRTAA